MWRSEEGDLLVSTLHWPLTQDVPVVQASTTPRTGGGMWVESGASESPNGDDSTG